MDFDDDIVMGGTGGICARTRIKENVTINVPDFHAAP
jgi:hypothetical protein